MADLDGIKEFDTVEEALASNDPTAMEVHMARKGVDERLIAAVADALQNQDRTTPAY
jgi:hypothetical protein